MKKSTLLFFIVMSPFILFSEEGINHEFRDGYQMARESVLKAHGPILMAKGDFLILFYKGDRKEVRYIPEMYHKLKVIDHIPVALQIFSDYLTPSKENLIEYEKSILQLRQNLHFPEHLINTQRIILDKSLALIDELKRGNHQTVPQFCREIGPLLLENASEAAFIQLEALHTQVNKWKETIPKDDWNRIAAIVIGPQTPRVGEVNYQYFECLIGDPTSTNPSKKHRRLIYAENLWDEKEALNLLATHIIDERIGHLFFDDKQKLFRDILSEGASRRLEEKCDSYRSFK